MKRFLIAISFPLLFAVVFNGPYCTPKQHATVKIIKQTTDERGLTSVIYVEDGDTVGLDYITPHELDSLTNK